MAEENQAGAITSAFPAPPSHYKAFTASNLDALQSHLSSSSTTTPLAVFNPLEPTKGTIPDVSTIPPELRELIPPPLPPSGIYRTFNETHHIHPPAAAQAPPIQSELHNLLKQILLKFLEITHILSLDPSMKYYVPAWEKLEALFKELHAGLNSWRPHQGRETLIRMMEAEIENLRSESALCRERVNGAKEVLAGLGPKTNGLKRAVNGAGEAVSSEKRLKQREEDKEKSLWETLDGELDQFGRMRKEEDDL